MAFIFCEFKLSAPLESLIERLVAVPGLLVDGDWIEFQQSKMLSRNLTSDSPPWRSLMEDWGDRKVYRVILELADSKLEGRLFNEGLLISNTIAPKLSHSDPVAKAIRFMVDEVAFITRFELG